MAKAPTSKAGVDWLPVAGILAFALCSTWSVFNLLNTHAAHPTALYWLPAVLVEIITAWTVAQVVAQVRELTKSKLSKQDRRFYAIITGAFVLVAAPLIGLSAWANTVEFGNKFLGIIFPISCIGCAIGAALPGVMETHRERGEKEKAEAAAERAAREAARNQTATMEQRWEAMGKARETARYFEDNPTATQASAAGTLGISRRTVGNHLAALESAGLFRRNGRGKSQVEQVEKEIDETTLL